MWRRKRTSFFPELITNPSTLRLTGGLFGSPRSREVGETSKLYTRVKSAFDGSRFADDTDTAANDFALALILEAAGRLGGEPILPLGEALWTLVHGLIAEDGLLFGFPKVSSFETMPTVEYVDP